MSAILLIAAGLLAAFFGSCLALGGLFSQRPDLGRMGGGCLLYVAAIFLMTAGFVAWLS